jgi:hypothetical protein
MPKYKISKSNLKEFFGILKKKKTPDEIQKLVDTDPVLQRLQRDLRVINSRNEDYLEKLKITNPKIYQTLKNSGMIS